MGGANARIEVITTASSIPLEVAENYMTAFSKIGCTNVDVLNIRNREDAKKQEFETR